MRGAGRISMRAISLSLWAVVIFLPLAVLFVEAIRPGIEGEALQGLWPLALRSFGLAGIVAGAAVALGWLPGRLLGTSRRGRDLLLMLLLMPLVLPRYVLYYGWSLLLTPTSGLGRYLSARPEAAKLVWTIVSGSVLVLWYWPLAALLIAQGWRNFDKRIHDSALLDTHGFEMFRRITLPILGRSLALAFAVCFVLASSEFATFDLAGVRTIGPELAVLYQLTGSEGAVARAAWPVVVAALVAAVWLGRSCRGWPAAEAGLDMVEFKSQRWRWGVLLGLTSVCLLGPLALFLGNIRDSVELRRFMTLHLDELGWSLAVSGLAAVGAYVIALGSLSLEGKSGWMRRVPGFAVRTTIFLAMFVPASVVAVSLLKLLAVGNLPGSVRQGWFIVSAGQAARFAGVALVMLLMGRGPEERHLHEMARLDGASNFQAWWHVHLPRTWPLAVGTLILLLMLGVTELSATMVLLPAGLPNFAQRLLNQMHYANDQQVIASCLVLICVFVLLCGLLVLMLRVVRLSGRAAILIVCAAVIGLAGCDGRADGRPRVVNTFGRTGRGACEFVYPRAIDIAADGSLVVIDKTGRIQRIDTGGEFLGMMNMPAIEYGKPTGLTFHPNGNLYVADTHYNRVLVFSPQGEVVGEFGKFGEGDGCFIYPTDVTFSEKGEIYVSEYGGNDRISVFSENGVFLRSFGGPGSGEGQFSRPSAMCIDGRAERLYVADACNHRIAVYSLEGELIDYIGSAGRLAGRLRYPYDLAIMEDGTLAVCEFGNNRIQLFSPDGRSLAVYGEAGSELGQLAYPWGVAVDKAGRAFIVDAGNNRIQVWQL